MSVDELKAKATAYEKLLATANAVRLEFDSVPELLAIAEIADELGAKLRTCQRRLERLQVVA